MLCASICHTDFLRARGYANPSFPLALGHEGVGVVESVGERVTDLKVGDVVIPVYIGECGECENCASGESNMCMRYPLRVSGLMPDDTSRISIRGQKAYHLFTCSTWCEYMVSDANYLIKVDPSIDLAHASFISCGFSTGFGASWKTAQVRSGSTVAVFGLGAVGLGAISGAKMMGATKIIGIDINEKKKERGEAFGMTDFINPNEHSNRPSSQLVKDLTSGLGVDYAIECTGFAPLVTQALESTKVGRGKAVAIGAGIEECVQVNWLGLLLGRTLKGSVFGGLKPKSDLSIVAAKCQNKDFPLDELLTYEVPLTEINKAFDLFKQPDCVKVIIKM
ncbi:8-hydroxygeraniol oxidoreductase-like isoform X2 [Prosopis cineraria]|nr:8-hydroxygeraniol oxidoreductase-like isoform X2 [Prosopis cineraria]XP_054813106.1 8-hydroxygeraniol oxidoreductase-like isoform X2 [Prosopis cineraria]XP_054813107.1 8-hydroxygeraniol oxidoreductase-like isoform X2 [Prosopis cineraria]